MIGIFSEPLITWRVISLSQSDLSTDFAVDIINCLNDQMAIGMEENLSWQ